jgi:hypothetical protein
VGIPTRCDTFAADLGAHNAAPGLSYESRKRLEAKDLDALAEMCHRAIPALALNDPHVAPSLAEYVKDAITSARTYCKANPPKGRS